MSEATVNAIINNALSVANNQVGLAQQAANAASSASIGFAMINPPVFSYGISASEPAIPDVGNTTLTFEAQRDKIVALLSAQLGSYFTQFYPLATDGLSAAMNWVVNSITVGGTGIKPAVEDQIYQRARDRVIADGLRVEAQTINDFAAKGFSLPPGALASRLQQVRFEQLAKTQDLSRDVAIKQAEMEIENLRFAVDQAIKARMQALQASADYIRALMSGVDVAARVAALNVDAKARAMSATADLYRARLTRDEIAMKIPMINQDVNMRALENNQQGFYKGISARVAAATAAAEVYGKGAQAALSSLSAIGSTGNNTFN